MSKVLFWTQILQLHLFLELHTVFAMHLFSKFLTRSLLFLIAIIFLITLGINLTIYFSNVRGRLALKAQEALGLPISIGFIYYTPFTGLHVQSISFVSQKASIKLSSLALDPLPILKGLSTKKTWYDQIKIKKILLNHHPLLKHVKVELEGNETSVSIPKFTARVGEGKINGFLLINPTTPLSQPYQFKAEFSRVSLKELFNKTNFEKNVIEGIAEGNLHLSGIINKLSTLKGAGTLNILQAELKPSDFLIQFGQLFQIEELQLLRLNETKVDYRIANNQLLIDSARLNSNNLALTANGSCSFNGDLNLNSKLLLNTKLQGRLQGIVPNELLAIQNSGYAEIPFSVYGSINHPQTDLLNKIGSQKQIKNTLTGLIQGFLR